MIFRHGTRCAGVIAGKRNGRCRNGGGIAYNAQIAGKHKTKNTYSTGNKIFTRARNSTSVTLNGLSV